MKVTELKLRNFTVFEGADFTFAPGINVLIGENATGKSHVLKAIYALLKTGRAGLKDPETEVRERLAAIFRPDDRDIGRLVRIGSEDLSSFWLKTDGGETHCSLTELGDLSITLHRWSETPKACFLPAREVLAMFEGFVALYKNANVSFDETYFDICVALQDVDRRGEAKSAADAVAEPLRSMLGGGEVELREGRFYVDLGDGPREAPLVAEGMRKIATLAYLAGNGSIAPGGILLWDEPEANLNPRLIAKLAGALRELAARGVQIVLATHDFLLAHRISLAAEYGVEPKVETRFFSLHRDASGGPVEVESDALVTGLQNNPILDEYARYYGEQRKRFHEELERQRRATAQ
jgi:energy-coupling factor transporter ATP-binding protein EcfA2